MLEQGFKSY
jgi:hypothetical protein